MEQLAPLWLPNEKECIGAILESLIDEGVLATRQKLGLPGTLRLDENFYTNLGLDFELLLTLPDVIQMLSEFFPYFWLIEQSSWVCVPLSDGNTAPVLLEALKGAVLRWGDAGTLIVTDTITPRVVEQIRANRDRLVRVITLLGPRVSHACTAWGLRRDQYKALVCQDTLEVVDPHVRWNMIYGSRML
jgi:hypothetical protein